MGGVHGGLSQPMAYYIVSPIVTKIAQQIDLVVLNNLRSFRILISAFTYELLNVKVEKFDKTDKKGNNSYIVSRIVLKIAQRIDLVILNILRFLRILISAFVFELFAKNCWFTPYVLFLVTAAMFLTRRTNRTQFII